MDTDDWLALIKSEKKKEAPTAQIRFWKIALQQSIEDVDVLRFLKQESQFNSSKLKDNFVNLFDMAQALSKGHSHKDHNSNYNYYG